ncbi:MAG: von Willebrand factor type A domain-containing protein, partial [Planctomycetes bacterium]|nr:von Willebrand factor type A domain-containing protein [Planctomycetota bacterium]
MFKKIRNIVIVSFVIIAIVAVIAAIAIPNMLCSRMSANYMLSKNGYYPPAHGGTTPPNSEVYDAMFFKNYGVNPFVDTEDDHFSTFAIDVDTASYAMARSYLKNGNLPPNEAVRTEEFINFFNYNYPPPKQDTLAIYLEGAPSKFGKNCSLLRIGLKAKKISVKERKDAILTFVIDVSGSMEREDRLGLVKKSLRLLIDELGKNDKVGIVIYGSRGEILMTHKSLKEKNKILSAIDLLQAGGSTYAEEGIRLGYELANKAYQKNYINRVILCSDGVANVGQTGAEDILKTIKKYTDKGIYLSAI